MKIHTLSLIIVGLLIVGCSTTTIDAEPPEVIETGIDPDTWAMIPAGPFYEGLHAHPEEIAYDYEIMVTDVTNAQFAVYLNEALAEGYIQLEEGEIVGYYPGDVFRGYEHEEPIEAGDWLHVPLEEEGLRLDHVDGNFDASQGYDNHPMVQVTWFGAKAYCEFYGGRLPSELEWEKAARGTDERAYPWGNEVARNNANFYSSHDIFEKTFGKLGDTTPVGFYNGKVYESYETLDSQSPYGLYDMAGNVWQWTADVYEDQHYRYLRGGSKQDYGYNLRVWTRNSAAPYYFSPNVGFRCVR